RASPGTARRRSKRPDARLPASACSSPPLRRETARRRLKRAPPCAKRCRTMRRRLGALALAAATALLLTWPLARHPTTRLLDDGTLDGFQFTWNLWWVRTALLTGQNPFFTRELFYPDGIN